MSDASSNGTIIGATSKVTQALIGALPPAFLLLCLINVAFLSMVMWFLNGQMQQRTELVQQIVNRCFEVEVKGK